MFIVKYALKSISRSIGRNVLIGIIVIIIATAACVAMSIQQAANTAAANSLKGMNISAQVYIDRGYVYKKASENLGTTDMSELMPEMMTLMKDNALDLSDMEEYSKIKKPGTDESIVKDYYYNASLSVNGEDIKKYDLSSSAVEETTSAEETTAAQEATTQATTPVVTDPEGNVIETPTVPDTPTVPTVPEAPQEQQMEQTGDFSLIGYSSYQAMEDFSGDDEESVCSITDGKIFEDNTSEYVCIVEDNLATLNDLSVGDTITLENPNNEDENYELEITGIYKNSSGSSSDGNDAANTIITSYAVVKDIEAKSEETNAGTSGDSSDTESTTSATDSTKATEAATTKATEAATQATESTTTASGTTSDSSGSSEEEESKELVSQFEGTFIFGSVADYNTFKEEVKNKAVSEGFDEDMYIVTSSDVASFKEGLKPLENLKTFATTFLYLTLAIGAIVLIVISVISIRDRKYEIGVLAAMGIKKLKLSLMFMVEVLTVTLVAILIGAAIGSAVSVPVTNNLLSAQVQQQEIDSSKQQQQVQTPGMPSGDMKAPEDGEVSGKVDYIDSVEFSVDIFVVLKMLAIGIGLAIVSGFTSILFILRYDPKQILANRD